MKKVISSYIVAGTTEMSRLLRVLTVFLISILLFSLAMYSVYATAMPVLLSMLKALDIGWPLVFSILGLFKNYLIVALIFLVTMVVIGYLAYEREDRTKVWDGCYNVLFFVTLFIFSIASLAFTGYYVVQGSLGDSFYHFLSLVISIIAFISLAISFPLVTTLATFSDFLNYFTKVYAKNRNSYILLAVALSTIAMFLVASEVGVAFLAVLFYIIMMLTVANSLHLSTQFNSSIKEGNRKNLLKLRGYEFHLEHEDCDLVRICLNDFKYNYFLYKKDKENGTDIDLNIELFSDSIANLYEEIGLSKETLIYMHITEFTITPVKDSNKVGINMKVDYYDLDNNPLKLDKRYAFMYNQ